MARDPQASAAGGDGTPDLRDRTLRDVDAGHCSFVDLHFTDIAGAVKSVMLPAGQWREVLHYGHWFDGSALEGGARAMETDLLLRPDLATWGLLPWPGPSGDRTARVICDVQTPDGDSFPADPRAVLTRALQDAADLGYQFQVACEVEFFLFRAPRGSRPALHPLAAGPMDSAGYFDLPDHDVGHIRDVMVQVLGALGVPVEASHHEIAPGQQELDLPLLPALRAADAFVTCKYVVRSVARRHGLLATFMPKPLAGAAGSGLHLHQVLLDSAGRNALADAADEHGLSAAGRAFIAGQLAHARAMCAVLAPSVNSYKRIGRGFDAPSSLAWSHSNPLAVIRVPRAGRPGRPGRAGPQSDGLSPRIELRCADPSCNPYLALAVALAGGLDGIRAGLEPPAPVDSSEQEAGRALRDDAQVEVLPASLGEAIGELEWDPVVRNALGTPVYERLLAAKEQEWQEYRRQVSAWELERYFESA